MTDTDITKARASAIALLNFRFAKVFIDVLPSVISFQVLRFPLHRANNIWMDRKTGIIRAAASITCFTARLLSMGIILIIPFLHFLWELPLMAVILPLNS